MADDDFHSKPLQKAFWVGTSEYMAPELVQVKHNTPAPQDIGATDVFSFGVLLWELCAQQHPYRDCKFQTQFELLKNVKEKNWRPCSEAYQPQEKVLPEIPAYLQSLIQRCWDTKPKKRPSFADIRKELQEKGALAFDFHQRPVTMAAAITLQTEEPVAKARRPFFRSSSKSDSSKNLLDPSRQQKHNSTSPRTSVEAQPKIQRAQKQKSDPGVALSSPSPLRSPSGENKRWFTFT